MIPPASHPEGSVQRIGPGDIRDLPSGLQKLIGAPKRLSAQRLWRALNADEKSATLKEHIHPKENRAELVQLVAEARNFRRKTVNGWDDDKIVQAAQPLSFSNPLAASLLSLMHLKRRREMLARFLDALGIPNEDGIVPPDEEGVATRRHEVGEAEAHAAAVDLAREHGLRRVVVYFLTLAILGEPFADHLWSWLKGLSASTDEVAEADPEATPLDDAETYIAGSEGDPSRQRSFTTLDRLLIEAIVDSKQGVVGSLDEDEVNDAVDEFASLNGRRQHSYFHLGFRDVLFDGGPRPKLPATNRKRARWYWAGAILGWAREFANHGGTRWPSADSCALVLGRGPPSMRIPKFNDLATGLTSRPRKRPGMWFARYQSQTGLQKWRNSFELGRYTNLPPSWCCFQRCSTSGPSCCGVETKVKLGQSSID